MRESGVSSSVRRARSGQRIAARRGNRAMPVSLACRRGRVRVAGGRSRSRRGFGRRHRLRRCRHSRSTGIGCRLCRRRHGCAGHWRRRGQRARRRAAGDLRTPFLRARSLPVAVQDDADQQHDDDEYAPSPDGNAARAGRGGFDCRQQLRGHTRCRSRSSRSRCRRARSATCQSVGIAARVRTGPRCIRGWRRPARRPAGRAVPRRGARARHDRREFDEPLRDTIRERSGTLESERLRIPFGEPRRSDRPLIGEPVQAGRRRCPVRVAYGAWRRRTPRPTRHPSAHARLAAARSSGRQCGR